MGLLETVLDNVAVRAPIRIAEALNRLSDEELDLKILLDNGHKNIGKPWSFISTDDYVHGRGEAVGRAIAELHARLPAYKGRFRDYFTNSLEKLVSHDKIILGY